MKRVGNVALNFDRGPDSLSVMVNDRPEGTVITLRRAPVSDLDSRDCMAPVKNSACRVTYDLNGGRGATPADATLYAPDSVAVAAGRDDIVPPANKTFYRWNTRPDGTGTFHATGSPLVVTRDITLYAIHTGDGSESRPVEIRDAADLAAIGTDTLSLSKRYVLVADLDAGLWNPIGSDEDGRRFSGVFDGGGHTVVIGGIDGAPRCTGLFGAIEAGTVRNLSVAGNIVMDSELSLRAGAVTGVLNVGSVVENCRSSLDITLTSDDFARAGGIAGMNHGGEISNCHTSGTLSAPIADGVAGGIAAENLGVGSTEARITNCCSRAVVSASKCAGGIAGTNIYGAVTNCVALNAAISGETKGRIVGDGNIQAHGGRARSAPAGSSLAPLEPLMTEPVSFAGQSRLICGYGGAGIPETWKNAEKDGANCDARPDEDWWSDPATWQPGSAWNFERVWRWDGGMKLPRLRVFSD
jgi:hypothetical protein